MQYGSTRNLFHLDLGFKNAKIIQKNLTKKTETTIQNTQ